MVIPAMVLALHLLGPHIVATPNAVYVVDLPYVERVEVYDGTHARLGIESMVIQSDEWTTTYETADGDMYEFTDRPRPVGTTATLVVTPNNVLVIDECWGGDNK